PSPSPSPSRLLRPCPPGMTVERVIAVGGEERHELTPLRRREAGADTDMLQVLLVVVQTEQQRTDSCSVGVLVPAKAGDDAVALAEQVEEHHRSRHLPRQLLHARRRRVQPELQRLEVEPRLTSDHDLAVEHTSLGQLGLQWSDELGEIPLERLLVATLDVDLI